MSFNIYCCIRPMIFPLGNESSDSRKEACYLISTILMPSTTKVPSQWKVMLKMHPAFFMFSKHFKDATYLAEMRTVVRIAKVRDVTVLWRYPDVQVKWRLSDNLEAIKLIYTVNRCNSSPQRLLSHLWVVYGKTWIIKIIGTALQFMLHIQGENWAQFIYL